MKIKKGQLHTAVPNEIEFEVTNVTPTGNGEFSLCTLVWEGGEVEEFPILNAVLSKLLSTASIDSIPIESATPSHARRAPRVGPREGDVVKGKICSGWDFKSRRLPGKRRCVHPDSHLKGFPLWEDAPREG